jgi:hypothetical protein
VLVMIQRRSRTHEGAVALSSFSRASATRRGAVPAHVRGAARATGDWRGLSSSASLFLFTIPAGIVVTHAHDRRRVGAPSRRVVNTRPADEGASARSFRRARLSSSSSSSYWSAHLSTYGSSSW